MRPIIVFALMLALAAPAHAAEMPTAFRGHWAPDLAECRDPDWVRVMSIDRGSITFYEAQTVEGSLQIVRSTKTELVVTNRMRGEGKVSRVTLKLRLGANRQTLTWSGFGRDPNEPASYVRCPK